MAEAAKVDVDEAEAPPKKKGKGGLLIGLAAMLLLGGGGFFATYSGMFALPFGAPEEAGAGPEAPAEAAHAAEEAAPTVFVEIPQMIVTLGGAARARHLRLSATLDVAPERAAEVEALMPRIRDAINTYLNALDEADVERPAAMARMRAHLLRRLKIVAGEDAVRDLLITEFVLQ